MKEIVKKAYERMIFKKVWDEYLNQERLKTAHERLKESRDAKRWEKKFFKKHPMLKQTCKRNDFYKLVVSGYDPEDAYFLIVNGVAAMYQKFD